ncbi:MAG TPA: hypothetical protein PKC79_09235 [Solidesulfovibrio magneticus]|nr:hypothetical protein [Solidesulfovibrio magneticus]
MVEKVGHIKNPLSIIAVFAALAEVGGTIVLPFLQSETQSLYVWFLMIFPALLVGAFFYVLYRKHFVLYAPSDYQDEQLFRDMFVPTPSRLSVKVSGEIESDKASESCVVEEKSAPNVVSCVADPSSESLEAAVIEPVVSKNNAQNSDLLADSSCITDEEWERYRSSELSRKESIRNLHIMGLWAEELVIAKLSADMNIAFERNVALRSKVNVQFDAVGMSSDRIVFLYIQYTNKILKHDSVEIFYQDAQAAYCELSDTMRDKARFVFVVISEEDNCKRQNEEHVAYFRKRAKCEDFVCDMKCFSLKELEKDVDWEIEPRLNNKISIMRKKL